MRWDWKDGLLGGTRRSCNSEECYEHGLGLHREQIGGKEGTIQATRQSGSPGGYCATREDLDAESRPSLNL